MSVKAKAERLLQLHSTPPILVLPNAWDAASARMFAMAGFPAIATTSGGCAYTLGYADGEQTPLPEVLYLLRRIVQTVDVPVTADMEAGYADGPVGVGETTRAVIDTGAVGMNLEDSVPATRGELLPTAAQCRKIAAVKQAAAAVGVGLVLNARVDVYLKEVGDPAQRLQMAVERANAYREAGADCLFVPGVRDAATIQALAEQINGPINVLVGPGTPPISELARLGVARVTLGSGPARAAMMLGRQIGQELQESGTYERFLQEAVSAVEANKLFARPARGD